MMEKGFIFKFSRVVIIIGVAVGIALVLIKLKPKAERRIRTDTGLLVEAVPVKAENVNMMIEAYGTVKPREALKLVAEVRGRIVRIDSVFKEGSFVNAGKTLIKIDPRTYRLEVERRKAQVSQADAELKKLQQEVRNIQTSIKIAKSEAVLTKAEFFRLKKLAGHNVVAQATLDKSEQQYLSSLDRVQSLENQLALTGPSREQLLAQRDLVRVQLKQAKIDLEKTGIVTPFDGWVQKKDVEIGQYVNIGESLGSIYRDGAYDIEVRLPVRDLKWLPNILKPQSIPEVTVLFDSQDSTRQWQGRLARIKAQMDERTRTLPVVVEIDQISDSNKDQPDFYLRPGLFVKVRIKGKEINRAFVLPRYMLHSDDVVYLVKNNHLRFRPVGVFRRFKESVFIDRGLTDGDMVVKTPISGATDGMRIRLR